MKEIDPNIYKLNSELFDKYLVDFQTDIKRIVGKFKKNFHSLSDGEIYSECNLHLLKNKDKIIETFEEEMPLMEFKKIAYHYCKNEAIWSHYRNANKAYNRRRLDGTVETEDGTKTIFEVAVEQRGEENKDLDNDDMFLRHISSNFFHIVTKYSYLLTEMETKILSYLRKGETQEQIAERFEVTHQAISASTKSISSKLQSQFTFEEIMQADSNMSVVNSTKAFDSFFVEKNKKITKEDRNKLQTFVKKHPSEFTAKDLAKKLFNFKYSTLQVANSLRRARLSHLTRSPVDGRYQGVVKEKLIKLLKKGLSNKEVAEKMNIEEKSVAGFRTHLVKSGELKSIQKGYRSVFSEEDLDFIQKYAELKLSGKEISKKFLEIKNKKVPANKIRGRLGHLVRYGKIESRIPEKYNFSKDERKKILELWQQGKSCAEISEILDIKASLIPPVIGYFVRKKMIKPKQTRMFSDKQVEKIMNLYDNNYTAKQIAKIMNVKNPRSIITLRGYLQRS